MHISEQLDDMPGHYRIAGYPAYAITKDGLVYSRNTDSYLTGTTNPAGYHNFRLTNFARQAHTWGRHRLLAFVFKHPGVPIDGLVVNHINGVKGDDRLDNLEWLTHAGNLYHAVEIGLSDACTAVMVNDLSTGVISKYNSATQAASALGLSKDAMLYRLKFPPTRVFPELKQYKAADDPSPWGRVDNLESELLLNGRASAVVARNVQTGEVLRFRSMQEISSKFGFSPASLSGWLADGKQPVLPGFLQLKKMTDSSPWREVKDPYLELEETTGQKAVVVTNPDTGECDIYSSCMMCAKEMGISPTALNYRLGSAGTTVFSDGRTYRYYNVKNHNSMVPRTRNGSGNPL